MTPGHRWVDTADALEALVEELSTEPEIALDTEFHRERTYFPEVALVQLGWPGGVALVDTLAVSPAPLARLFGEANTIVMHAASQDLEVLQRECAAVPERLFDTQLAAGFCGYGTPSLASLLEGELGISLPKGDRLTDWLRRPLGADQREYAAADVLHLLPLADALRARLAETGRAAWADDECAELRRRAVTPRHPDEAWWRVKEARSLRGKAMGVAQALGAWRERRAAETDQPVRFVLPDLALVGIAQRPPADLEALRRVRGLDDRHLRHDAGRQILEAVAEGLALPRDRYRQPPSGEVDRHLRPAIALVSAWIAQLARDLRIDTTLIATRSDLEALLRGAPDARLTHGWRAEAVGDAIQALVAGEAAIAFERGGTLALERRSREPLAP